MQFINCVEKEVFSSGKFISYCSNVFCCQRQDSEMHLFAHVDLWMSLNLSCFDSCWFCIQVTTSRFSLQCFCPQSDVSFAVMKNLGEPSSGRGKGMSSGREPEQPGKQGQKNLLPVSEVETSIPVRDDLYLTYISPWIQRNSTAPEKWWEWKNICVFPCYFCLKKALFVWRG